ncbi:MAG: hypothetical protein JRJ59_06030, partial [Deltaproteobacteria bacterium]|nr:hypothetical protein [Deltaproteobacteria bacterium]
MTWSGWRGAVAVGVGLWLAAVLGCSHLNRWPVEDTLRRAHLIRQEVEASPDAEVVEKELAQSVKFQTEAEVLLNKARARPLVDLENKGPKYVNRAQELADMSLTTAELA